MLCVCSFLFNSFRATLYQCPETANDRFKMLTDVENRINDLQNVLRTTEDHCNTHLLDIAGRISEWQQMVWGPPPLPWEGRVCVCAVIGHGNRWDRAMLFVFEYSVHKCAEQILM